MAGGRQTVLVSAILVLGFAGIIAQTVLLRELLIQFSGNEFSVGIIIGNWVAAEALGAFLAGRYLKQRRMGPVFFILLTLLFSILFPLLIMLVRAGKLLAGIPTDIGMTLVQTFCAALFFLFPAAALHGFQFVAATSLYSRLSGDENSSSGRVYALESLGTMAGGLLAALALIPFLSSLQIAALNLILSGAASVVLFGFGSRLRALAWAVILLVATPFIFSLAHPLEQLSLSWEWHGRELLTSSNSPYQNIAVIRNGEQITLYTDGVPAATLPHPDIATVEELVHIPMLAHPSPQNVLLIGGGAAGLLAELLKYGPLLSVDYIEQDPEVLAAVAAFAPESFTRLLKDPQVRLHYSDARELLARGSGKKYDLVLLGASLPQTLQGNRFFTLEFFRLIRERLAAGGIVAFAVPGSTAYYGAELQEINGTLMATVRAAFPYLLVMPDDTNLFLASSSRVDLLEPGTMASRLMERRPATSLITPEHLSWRMDPGQRDWFERNSGAERGEVNRDFAPRLLSGNLAYATIIFNPWLKQFLGEMRSVGSGSTVVCMVLLLTCFALIGFFKPALTPFYVIAATGFAGMLLEMMLIFTFQLYTGVMFQSIALLMALFMAGLCAGSLLATRTWGDMKLLMAGEAGLLLLAATAALFFFGASRMPALSPFQAHAAILPLLFAVGLCAGLQFPAAVRLVSGSGSAVSGVGVVYAVDLVGGWFGGVVGGALLLPFLGFSRTALILLSLKTGSFLLLQMQRKKCKM